MAKGIDLIINMRLRAVETAEKYISDISDIDIINRAKHLNYGTITTEYITGIEQHVLECLASCYKKEIILPNKSTPTAILSLKFSWGVLNLIQMENAN